MSSIYAITTICIPTPNPHSEYSLLRTQMATLNTGILFAKMDGWRHKGLCNLASRSLVRTEY